MKLTVSTGKRKKATSTTKPPLELKDVITVLSNKNLHLVRIGDTITVAGECSDHVRMSVRHHSEVLLPLAKESPSTSIRRLIVDFAEWVNDQHSWAADYCQKHIDGRLSLAVDTNDPQTVIKSVDRMKQEIGNISLAEQLFPFSLEVEAKHAALENAFGSDGCPF
ncbi:MAG: hypothetical protein ABGZ17_28790 [Planctomycetaceae bacterium]